MQFPRDGSASARPEFVQGNGRCDLSTSIELAFPYAVSRRRVKSGQEGEGSVSNRRDELKEFKQRINLTEYAAAYGYQLDRKASSRNSAVMKHAGGDKLIVAKAEDGNWIYFSVHDSADNGSIIDFEQRRQGGTLGDVRKSLRNWMSGSLPPHISRPSPELFVPRLDPVRKSILAVRVCYEAMSPIDGRHDYLEHERKIPVNILTDPLFADRIRVDQHGNAIFPHFNQRDGLCGYEVKNRDFTGFASGGVKGLWFSQAISLSRRLIIAETAIDALSYAALKDQPGSRYVSTGGELNPDQPVLLEAAMKKLPNGSRIILAVDQDAGGDKIGARIEAILGMVNRPDLVLNYDRPITANSDWNDVLRTTASTPTSRRTPRPKP
jgi:hypothetical protein